VADEPAEHPFAGLVRERGGAPLADPARAAALAPAGLAFVAVLARDEETLPPVARVGPRQAAGWLLLAGGGGPGADGGAAAARALADALEASGLPAYLLTAGRVGGGAEEPRSREIAPALVARVIDAAIAGEVDWEADPDFGYELPMDLPGLGRDERRVLVPRFLYARTDRVYDYAAMVPRLRRERAARLDAIAGLGPVIGDAFDAPANRR
jgi:phosphoenolpyruvate carboxykinase (ATP)